MSAKFKDNFFKFYLVYFDKHTLNEIQWIIELQLYNELCRVGTLVYFRKWVFVNFFCFSFLKNHGFALWMHHFINNGSLLSVQLIHQMKMRKLSSFFIQWLCLINQFDFSFLNLAFEANWLGFTPSWGLWNNCRSYVSHECHDVSIGQQKWFGSNKMHGIRYESVQLRSRTRSFSIQPKVFYKHFPFILALVHDLAESIVGDITPYCGVSKEDKKQREMDAMREIAELIAPRGQRLWNYLR